MWVTVEGMFTFDFSSVESYADPDPPDAISDFDSIAEMVIRRSWIMNAYLAFFYTHQIEIDKHSQRRMVATPEVMISATVVDGKIASQAFGNQRNSHLATSRFDRTYSSYIPHSMDSRINMRPDEKIHVRLVRGVSGSFRTPGRG